MKVSKLTPISHIVMYYIIYLILQIGEEIMITSTSMDPSHTEVVTISNVDNKVITFTPSLQHRHLGRLLVRAFSACISTTIHSPDWRLEYQCITLISHLYLSAMQEPISSNLSKHFIFCLELYFS